MFEESQIRTANGHQIHQRENLSIPAVTEYSKHYKFPVPKQNLVLKSLKSILKPSLTNIDKKSPNVPLLKGQFQFMKI